MGYSTIRIVSKIVYPHTHTHTHTHIYIYIYENVQRWKKSRRFSEDDFIY